MSLSLCLRKAVLGGGLALAIPLVAGAQTGYVPASGYLTNGGEYPVIGSLPGDQVFPAVAYGTTNGYIVWEDNITDTNGTGISVMRLDSSMSGRYASMPVNKQTLGNQSFPQAAMMKQGGAVFVWQGGVAGQERIYARFLGSDGVFVTDDIQVNTFNRSHQQNPAVATLADGNVVVIWASFNQEGDNSYQDVYGQMFTSTGAKMGQEFLVNQFVPFNQRSAAVAGLASGGFAVTWVSEQQNKLAPNSTDPTFLYSTTNSDVSVDIYCRLYQPNGQPTGNEFVVNVDPRICANPAIAAGADGGLMIAWSQKDTARTATTTNSWDIYARSFSATGSGGVARRVNTFTYGDQFLPKLAAAAGDYMVVWSSLGQDGAMEGVFGQVLRADGGLAGSEFQVNTAWPTRQIHPALAADARGRFLVSWASYTGGQTSFDLFAQRFTKVSRPLDPLGAPMVHVPFVVANGNYQPRLEVAWSEPTGIAVDHYEVFVDGSATPIISLSTNFWVMTAADGLGLSTTKSFQVAYVTTTDARSPVSASASAKTWGGWNYDGIPSEWLSQYYGSNMRLWPVPDEQLAPNGPTLMDVFISGGSPLDSKTWLQSWLSSKQEGFFVNWNPQPGRVYQVQASTDLGGWVNVDKPRLAADVTDSCYVGRSNGFYRVLLMR